jgi:hypothetical protein
MFDEATIARERALCILATGREPTLDPDGDWSNVFEYASDEHVGACLGFKGSVQGFGLDDVAYVIAAEEGENDGANWITVVRLQDGRYAFVSAGCDYTGWG